MHEDFYTTFCLFNLFLQTDVFLSVYISQISKIGTREIVFGISTRAVGLDFHFSVLPFELHKFK